MMGKYLNGYTPMGMVDGAPRFVPPGWSAWAVAGNGYADFNYNLLVKRPGNEPPEVVHYGNRPHDYMTDVLAQRGQRFIAGSVKAGKPFMLEIATFLPHGPFTPAPRHANLFPNARAPRGPLFNAPQQLNPPSWLPTAPLTNEQIAQLDTNFRKRAQSVQAIDEMIGAIRAQLRRLGAADNTYIVFSSDNGFHMGQRRLLGRQADVLRPRRPRADGGRRAGRPRRASRSSAWRRTSTCARRSRSSPERRSGRASRAAAWWGSCAVSRRRVGATPR